MSKSIIFSSILLTAITLSLSVQTCYQCGFEGEISCPEIDPSKRLLQKTCDSINSSCIVFWQRDVDLEDQKDIVARGCGDPSDLEIKCKEINDKIEKYRSKGACSDCGYCAVCNDTDLCNLNRVNDPMEHWDLAESTTIDDDDFTEEPSEENNLTCYSCGLQGTKCPEMDPSETTMQTVMCKKQCVLLLIRGTIDNIDVSSGIRDCAKLEYSCEKCDEQLDLLKDAGCKNCDGYCRVCNTHLCNKDEIEEPEVTTKSGSARSKTTFSTLMEFLAFGIVFVRGRV